MIRVSYRNTKNAAVILYLFTFKFMQLSGLIYPFQSMNYIVAFTALLIIITLTYKQENILLIYKDKANALILLLLLVITINNANLKRGDYYDYLYYFISILFFILLRIDDQWIYPAVRFLVLCDIFYLGCTILFTINKEFYFNNITTIWGLEYRQELMNWSRQNMAPGLFPHYTSNGVEMGLAVGIIFYGINNSKAKTVFSILALIALILTAKRSSFLAAIISVALIYLLYYGGLKKIHRYAIRNGFLILIFLVIGVVWIGTRSWDITLFQRFQSDGDSGRSFLYIAAMKLFKEHCLFGVGWDGFRFYYEARFGTNIDVHNVYLQLLCETGLIGFVLFLLFQAYCLGTTIRLLKRSRDSYFTRVDQGILRISLYVQIFYHISNCFENLLYSYSSFSIFLVACVMAINLKSKYEGKSRDYVSKKLVMNE